MKRSGIIAGGNFIRDFTRIIDSYPPEETLSNIIATDSSNGGAAYNVLKDLSMLKAPFPLFGIGMVGNDEMGVTILNDCEKSGINTDGINSTESAGTSFTDVILSRSSGKRTFFHYRGANALLDIEHFNFDHHNVKHFHFGYPHLLDTLDTFYNDSRTRASIVLEKAKESGLTVSVDLVSVNHSHFREIIYPSLPFIDYLFMNEIETEKLTGIEIIANGHVDLNKAEEAAKEILVKGATMVIIHFPEGAVTCTQNKFDIHGSVQLPKKNIAGATGAGDAFAAGFLYGIHEGKLIKECLQTGVCCAASCLEHATCSGGILPYDECINLGNQFGFRIL